MIEPRNPSNFYRRMKAARATGHDAEMAAEWTIAAFLRGIDALETRPTFTPAEFVRLSKLRRAIAAGEVTE